MVSQNVVTKVELEKQRRSDGVVSKKNKIDDPGQIRHPGKMIDFS